MSKSALWVLVAILTGIIVVGAAILFFANPFLNTQKASSEASHMQSHPDTSKEPENSSTAASASTPSKTETQPQNQEALITEIMAACTAEGVSKLPCYTKRLQTLIETSGTEKALDVLEKLGALDSAIPPMGHPLAHDMGHFSLQHYGDAAVAFGHCRELYSSGCYHGVLEAYLSQEQNVSREGLSSLCERIGQGRDLIIKFQCLHGLGHGLTMHFHELPESLSYCDFLPTQWDQESCYAGVFMEHIVAVNNPNPHHTHTHELKAEDPHYPCSTVEQKYLSACYLMQSSAILMLNGYNFADAFKICDGAPANFISICYQSMGRDVSGNTQRNTESSIKLCLLGTKPYVGQCIRGVVKDFINAVSNASPGIEFCKQVPDSYKWDCYNATGEMIYSLHSTVERKTADCQKAEPQYQVACRQGALL